MTDLPTNDAVPGGPAIPSLNLYRTMSRRDFVRASAFASLIVVGGPSLLAACGSGGSNSGTTELRIGDLLDMDTLNPLVTTKASFFHGLVYDRLMVYDAQLSPAMSLATSRSVSADGKQITFALRKNVTFHDGTPLTSADVKFSYELVKQTGLSYAAPYVANLTSVDTPDDYTVVTSFSSPVADDPALFVWILPQHLWSSVSASKVSTYANSSMVGSGPYKFSQWQHNSSYSVVRNRKYWGQLPQMTSITWIIYQSPETEELALRQGNIQLTQPLSATIFKGLKGASNIALTTSTATGFIHFGMNVWTDPSSKGNPLLLDRSLRQAINRAIDREKLVNLVLEGYGTPGSVIIMPAFKQWFLDIPASQQFSYNPTLANQLLDAAGYSSRNSSGIRQTADGRPLSFRLMASTSINAQVQSAQLIGPMLQAVGIETTLTTMTDGQLFQLVSTNGDFDFFVWNWVAPPPPTFMLDVETKASWHSSADVYYYNPDYETLVAQQATETDLAARQQLVYQAQQIFYEDCAYAVLFYMNPLIAERTDGITGWESVEGGIEENWTDAGLLALKPA
jgi:peptide/nickel transport system substrate-binding protein